MGEGKSLLDSLLHAEAPLETAEWGRLHTLVVSIAKRQLICRRALDIYGPLGGGVEVLPLPVFGGATTADVSMVGDADAPVPLRRTYLKLPMIYADFELYWRDLERSRELSMPTDWSAAESAARMVADREDQLILQGSPPQEVYGLLNAHGIHHLDIDSLEPEGSGFAASLEAFRMLADARFNPPYTVIVAPTLYARWHRLYGNSGVLEIDQIEKLAQSKVLVSRWVDAHCVLCFANTNDVIDLAIGLDWSVAYLESSQMNHRFRVLETLAPRIKRPDGIAVVRSPSHFVRAESPT